MIDVKKAIALRAKFINEHKEQIKKFTDNLLDSVYNQIKYFAKNGNTQCTINYGYSEFEFGNREHLYPLRTKIMNDVQHLLEKKGFKVSLFHRPNVTEITISWI